MALQLQVTGDAGMDITYWKITNLTNSFDGDQIDLRFHMNGYKDAIWRNKGASAKNMVFHVLQHVNPSSAVLYTSDDTIPSGSSIGDVKTPATAGGTGPVDRASTILSNTSGDLRPALYDWLKSHDATASPGVADDYGRASQVLDWSSAVDV